MTILNTAKTLDNHLEGRRGLPISAVIMLIVIPLLLLLQQGSTQDAHFKESVDHGNGTVVESLPLSCPGLWSISEDSKDGMRCRCGSELQGAIHCVEGSFKTMLTACFCMSSYKKDPNITVVGACMYMCARRYELDTVHMCDLRQSTSNREGQLCGQCRKGFVPPVYSYDWRCVKCLHDNFLKNLVKYCAVAFLPLTVFFVIVITFHISATSPSMNAFLLVCQVFTSPMQVRIVSSSVHQDIWLVPLFESLYGFWNLDFFRTVYSRFCLHPNMSTIEVLALDYIVAAYPLLLTAITYLLVVLHNRNCRLVVSLWKPFRICFARLQGQWNTQTSLIEAFVSFLLLSYVKFLGVSFDFLVPVHLYNVRGESMEPYLYIDGTVEYFGKQHLPYAILAILVLSIIIILPLLLLFIYPCHFFQNILNKCNLRGQALHIFMDAFQGCYKNGTDGTRDCRYFSAMYLLVRIFFFIVYAVTLSSSVIMACFIVGVMLTLFAILFTVVQPYKTSIYNVLDTILLANVALMYFCIVAKLLVGIQFTGIIHSSLLDGLINILLIVFISIPFFYITVVVLYWLFFRHTKMSELVHKLRLHWQRNTEESPYRLANPEECAALLKDPMNVDHYGSAPGLLD